MQYDKQTPTTELTGDMLTCEVLVAISKGQMHASLSEAATQRIAESRKHVDKIVNERRPAYGITTGVGSQKDHQIDMEAVALYNRRLVKGHATRVPGPSYDPSIVRGALVVLLNGFAKGGSGVTPELTKILKQKISASEMPTIDASGSVSASDLVPLAQTADWLLSSEDAESAGLPKAKETLSLINWNAFTLSEGAQHITELLRLLDVYTLALATTYEGFRSNLDAIAEPVNALHRRGGQSKVAADLRAHLKGSALWQSGASRFLQDPLSFRTASQIHGATFECFKSLESVWNSELNTVNDNPIIDRADGRAYSHGNMDTTRFTLALDTARQALAKVVDVSGERIHKQQWPVFSGLPIGLSEEDSATGGVQFLNLGHISSSLITSVKIWATPHLLNSVGQVADGVEDTASHAMHAVHDLKRQLDASWKIAALEMLVAVWAIHRRKLPLDELGKDVREVYQTLLPLLPIGHEGDAVFDLAEVIAAVKAIRV
ncbi:aromatic amino acid lyase [Pacificibacter sp.]|uniref:aromatic amino acid lyase n=1 Tax=Pacificibacter sp. TaxID=1917866 RepID=UPI00321AF65D